MTRLLLWIARVEKKLAMLCDSPSYLSGSSGSIRKRPHAPVLQEQTKTCTTIPEVHRTGCTSLHFFTHVFPLTTDICFLSSLPLNNQEYVVASKYLFSSNLEEEKEKKKKSTDIVWTKALRTFYSNSHWAFWIHCLVWLTHCFPSVPSVKMISNVFRKIQCQ